ncbi:MAG: CDP-diacylglycerol--serine O-phosphatidyltransferase [Planctomycetes bacterium]|nr:CDP-diacylglycerol--serine O-phosphatidyltransferase [Planctomycetota bacterium]
MKRFDIDSDKAENPESTEPTPRRRGARAVEMVPTLVTLGNLFSGFLAIAYLTDSMTVVDDSVRIGLIEKAAGLIFLAMFFDAVDGWVARKMGSSSDFGAQVDSICDAVSFGAAPALLFKVMCEAEPNGIGGKSALVLAVLFLACAVLRLARFNLETEADESSHQSFEGLPTPAAAAVIASLAYANVELDRGLANSWIKDGLPYLMPFVAFLMVSRFPYVHAASFLLKRKSFPMLIALVFLVGVIVLQPVVMVPGLCVAFMVWGPLFYLWRRLIQGKDEPLV